MPNIALRKRYPVKPTSVRKTIDGLETKIERLTEVKDGLIEQVKALEDERTAHRQLTEDLAIATQDYRNLKEQYQKLDHELWTTRNKLKEKDAVIAEKNENTERERGKVDGLRSAIHELGIGLATGMAR